MQYFTLLIRSSDPLAASLHQGNAGLRKPRKMTLKIAAHHFFVEEKLGALAAELLLRHRWGTLTRLLHGSRFLSIFNLASSSDWKTRTLKAATIRHK